MSRPTDQRIRQDARAIYVRLKHNYDHPPDVRVVDRVTGRLISYRPYKGWTTAELASHALGASTRNKMARVKKALPVARVMAERNGFYIPFASGTKLYILTDDSDRVRGAGDNALAIAQGFARAAKRHHKWASAREVDSLVDEPVST